MKRHGYESDGGERPAKVPRRGSSSANPEPLKETHGHSKATPPLSPSLPGHAGKTPDPLEHRTTTPTFLDLTATELADEIYQWIPAPSETEALEKMSQPVSKRSRSCSISTDTDRGRARSVSSDNSESSSARDTRSYAYRAGNYPALLERKGCFMRRSPAGPIPDDIALCERLLTQPIEPPTGTLFDDEYITNFHEALQGRSEARLFVDLHPLIMPSAESQFIRGNQSLAHVTDGYNDPWLKTTPIYGPKPQPDHARGLKWSAFTETQQRKLGINSDEKSPYTVRDDMFFPYMTAEIKCENQALKVAERQNMHSMCVAMRAVVSLYQAAGATQELHRRILGFSISHNFDHFLIHGYYPEVHDDGKVSFYRWPIAQPNVWTSENRWTCYRFAENVDREFLPIHTNRLIRILDAMPDPDDEELEVDVDEPGFELSIIGSQQRPGYRRAASSQSRALQPELRMMVQSFQQREEKLLAQLEEQKLREEQREKDHKEREEKREAEQKEREEKRDAEQKEREEKRDAEQKAREEKLTTQLEKLQGLLFARLEQKDESK